MFMPHIDQVNNNIDELLAHDNIEKLQSYDLKSTYTDSKRNLYHDTPEQ